MIRADRPTSRSISLPLDKLAAVAENPGAVFDGQQLLIPFFGTGYSLTPTEIHGPDDAPLSDKVSEILVQYVLNFPKQPPPAGRLISFRELDGAGPLVVSFANNTNKTITATFSGKLAELKSAARSLSGDPRSDIPGYDLTVVFQALPGIHLTLQFNDAQSPFPAQSSLLLDASIETYLDMPAIFALGTFLCGRLAASCYN